MSAAGSYYTAAVVESHDFDRSGNLAMFRIGREHRHDLASQLRRVVIKHKIAAIAT